MLTVDVALDAVGALPDCSSNGSGGDWEGLSRIWECSVVAQGGRRCENSGNGLLTSVYVEKDGFCMGCMSDNA